MLRGHWDISRRNHSTHVYTTLSPHWDTTAECVSRVPHLQVKRPTEQSLSGGPKKTTHKKKTSDSYLIGTLLLLCGQRDPYTMFLEKPEFPQATCWLHFQWIFPMKDASSLIHLFCFVQLKLTHAIINFSPKQWKQAVGAVVSFKQKDYARVIKQQNTSYWSKRQMYFLYICSKTLHSDSLRNPF